MVFVSNVMVLVPQFYCRKGLITLRNFALVFLFSIPCVIALNFADFFFVHGDSTQEEANALGLDLIIILEFLLTLRTGISGHI